LIANSNIHVHDGSSSSLLSPMITIFSTLAVITSLVGFTYGLYEAWVDVLSMMKIPSPITGHSVPSSGSLSDEAQVKDHHQPQQELQRFVIFSLIFLPPLLIALYNPNIFVSALNYGGTFGVTILFVLLPSYMIWIQRYSSSDTAITTATSSSNSFQNSTTKNDISFSIPSLVPGGKLPIIGLWMSTATVIAEQVIEKLGFLDTIQSS
jgi:amino acid permease